MAGLSRQVQQVSASGIRRFFDIAAQMPDAISLGVGEPDFTTPWSIRESIIWSLEQGYTTYTSNWGLYELRELIAGHIKSLYDVDYSPDNQILVTVGVSEGLDLALRAILDPGDEVIIFEPCYVSYKPCIQFAYGVPVAVESSPEDGFGPDVERFEQAITKRTKAVLLSYPSNPTGATASCETLARIVEVAARHDLFVISDEIYDRLTYTGTHTCVSGLPGAYDRTILLNGFSKAYAMTGMRIGYAAAPPALAEQMMKIHQYVALCAPVTAQMAAVEALRRGESSVQEMRSQYNRRRRLIVKRLNEMGLECFLPGGAFYVFPSVKSTGMTSDEFCERLLAEQKVVTVPGTAFGECGEGYIRASYATSIEKIEEAMGRMQQFVSTRQGSVSLK